MIYASYIFLAFTLLLYLINLALYIRAWVIHKPNKIQLHYDPTVSIIVPVYNEEVGIIESLQSMQHQTYKAFDIIVVNDGSTDATLQTIIKHFNMKENDTLPTKLINNYKPVTKTYYGSGILLIDKPNGGKSDALNAGFAYSYADYILSVDGDTILAKNCIEIILKYKRPDADAVATMVGISNDNVVINSDIPNPVIPKGMWARIQWFEYYRGYTLLRDSVIDKNCVTVISGACSLIKSEMIVKTGGYKHNHLGEDMEHTFAIHRQGGYVQFLNKIVSWTEVPDNIRDLGKQRVRWFRGGFESYMEYKDLLFTKNNKTFGWFMLPYIWFSNIFIPWIILFGAIFTIINLVLYHRISDLYLWFVVIILYYTNSLIAFYYLKYKLHLYKRFRGLFIVILIEGFTIYFLMMYWMLKSQILEITGTKRNWNKLERKGFKLNN